MQIQANWHVQQMPQGCIGKTVHSSSNKYVTGGAYDVCNMIELQIGLIDDPFQEFQSQPSMDGPQ